MPPDTSGTQHFIYFSYHHSYSISFKNSVEARPRGSHKAPLKQPHMLFNSLCLCLLTAY